MALEKATTNFDIETEQWSLKLPYDHLKTPNTSYNKSICNFTLDNKIFQHLASKNNQQNGVFFVAGFAALLYRYTGQTKIPLSLSIYQEFDKSKVMVNIHTIGKLQFGELLDDTHQLILNGFNPSNSSNQVSITIREISDNHTINSGRQSVENVQPCNQSDHADVHLVVLQNTRSTMVRIEYNSNLFRPDTIDRMGRHFENLLISATEIEDVSLADLNLFSDNERRWYYQTSRGGQAIYSSENLHQDIERHAAIQPDKLAVSSKQESLTYFELNQKSNQLAHFLLSKGISKESRVIVCVEPSVDIAVALLAILKTGATYIPLNPSHPEYRISTIIKDTDPELVITHEDISTVLNFNDLPILTLDKNSNELNSQSASNPNQHIEPHQTAFIYYTSGTTGIPKGSIGSYSNLSHYIRVSQEKYGFNSAEIMPALASYTFSISMFELLSPLVAGGTLKILNRSEVLDIDYMVHTLRTVTFVHVGPSLLKTLVKYIHRNITDYSIFDGLRHLSSGGDMVPPDLLRNLQLIFQNTELYVIYGCSEIACMGFTYAVDPIVPIEKTYVGKPFNNVALMLLDKEGNNVPIGVSGEVCIGGNGVAIGYLNRPELTDEKFFLNDAIRFYRTGDVGRLNPEGNLELLGREDFQIQIHGMRVELGEVEYYLRQMSGIQDGVVVARPHGGVENTLVAFYVKNEKYQVDSGSIRNHMTQYVPEYMVPSFYIKLDALPMNINNKLDRKALLNVDIISSSRGGDPGTKSEIELASLWSDLLQIDKIGLHDNFLAIGGDSLLAMEFIGRVQEQIGVKLNGLDVLRESLQVLSAICDDDLGRLTTSADVIDNHPPIQNVNKITSFFFGPNDSLYGLLHPVRKFSGTGVLICQPTGGEYKRCHFLLKVLADKLALEGIPVMRFDYFGTGDAQGNTIEASIDRWKSDITFAHQELLARTNCKSVTVLAIRLGATLAVKALDKTGIDRWILWDPITDGMDYYSNLLKVHKRKVMRFRVLNKLQSPVVVSGGEELMGFTYSDGTIEQLKNLSIEKNDFSHNSIVHQLHTKTKNNDYDEKGQPEVCYEGTTEQIHVDCDWYDPKKFNKAITDNRILDRLKSLILAE